MFARCIDDTQDDYRIILFEGRESLKSGTTLKHHLSLTDGPHRPSDQFLRLHFSRCLAVSVCRGDVTEDYEEQEIENFMEELGYYDGEMVNTNDPRWSTPLGLHVHAYLIREKLAEALVILFIFVRDNTDGLQLVANSYEPKQPGNWKRCDFRIMHYFLSCYQLFCNDRLCGHPFASCYRNDGRLPDRIIGEILFWRFGPPISH
jgi:hypothetical protein